MESVSFLHALFHFLTRCVALKRSWLFIVPVICVLAACGGGSGPSGGPPPPQATATPTPPVTASSSSAVTTSGGAVSTTLQGQTATVTIPANALSANATVTVTLFAAGGLPRAFASTKRSTLSLPAGAAFIGALSIDTGAATLLKPLSLKITANTPPAGALLRLAGSITGAFNDVDTATFTAGAITNDGNTNYAGPSLSGSTVLYGFYSIPSTSAAAPPAIAIKVTGAATLNGGQATYAATEADVNGFPVLGSTFTFGVDNAALGTIDPVAGVLTASTANNAVGNVTATDAKVTSRIGRLPVSVTAGRPANAGDKLSYTGTITKTIANFKIAPSPAPGTSPVPVMQTQSGTVTDNVTVASGASASQVVVSSDETDNFQLDTLETKTNTQIAYQTSGASTSVRLQNSSATDSNGVVYATTYGATSGLVTVLPEAAGAFGPNDATLNYSETDPGVSLLGAPSPAVTTQRTTASTGAYTEVTNNDDGSTNNATVNANLTGTYLFLGGVFKSTIAAPAAGKIPYSIAQLTNTGAFGPAQLINIALWYPSATTPLRTETDTIAAVTAYDASCTVPTKYGTTANLVSQSVVTVDPVFGTLDTFTSNAYDVNGVGTVCLVLKDTTSTFYDYTSQEGFFAVSIGTAPVPVLQSTYAESLSLSSAVVAGQPVSTQSVRRTASTAIGATIGSPIASAIARQTFMHAIQLDRNRRTAQAIRSMRSATGGLR
jgi:hypothetical protein